MAVRDEAHDGFGFMVLAPCDKTSDDQKWDWDTVNDSPLERANSKINVPGDDPPELDYIS